jgi:hypothetical protein
LLRAFEICLYNIIFLKIPKIKFSYSLVPLLNNVNRNHGVVVPFKKKSLFSNDFFLLIFLNFFMFLFTKRVEMLIIVFQNAKMQKFINVCIYHTEQLYFDMFICLVCYRFLSVFQGKLENIYPHKSFQKFIFKKFILHEKCVEE